MDCPSGEALGPAGSGGLAAGIGIGDRGHQLTRQKKREQRASRAFRQRITPRPRNRGVSLPMASSGP